MHAIPQTSPPAATLALERLTVAGAMHRGLITVAPDAELDAMAMTMAQQRVHCLLVEGIGEAGAGRSVWGIVSDLDLMRALDSRLDLDAARLAACEVLTIDASRALAEAVQLMVEHEAAHLIVTEAGRPVGVLSTYDIAAAISASAEGKGS